MFMKRKKPIEHTYHLKLSPIQNHSPVQKPGLLEKISDSITGQEIYNKSLEHLVFPQSKEGQNKIQTNQKIPHNSGICKMDVSAKQEFPMAKLEQFQLNEKHIYTHKSKGIVLASLPRYETNIH